MEKDWKQRNEWFATGKGGPFPMSGRGLDLLVKCKDGSIFEATGVWGKRGFELREHLDWEEVLFWKYFPRE